MLISQPGQGLYGHHPITMVAIFLNPINDYCQKTTTYYASGDNLNEEC
jgi:hypothetical protein